MGLRANPAAGEVWRVATLNRYTPAHLVNYQRDKTLVTACNWSPSQEGYLLTRKEMIEQGAFVCCFCAKAVLAR